MTGMMMGVGDWPTPVAAGGGSLTPTVKATAQSASNGASSVTTASFTPSNSSLLVAVFSFQRDLSAQTVTVSGGSLSWTRQAQASPSGNFGFGVEIWTAPVSTGASMTVTASTSVLPPNDVRYVLSVTEFTGYNTGTPVGATGSNVSGSRSGSYSLTLSGTTAASSYVVAGAVADSGTVTSGGGWSSIYNGTAADGFHVYGHEYKSGAMSSADWSALTSSFSTATAAIEIKA